MANMCNTDEKALKKNIYPVVSIFVEDEPLPIECLFQNECLLCFFKEIHALHQPFGYCDFF